MEKNLLIWEPRETDRARYRLAPYCAGNGLDIGYGGRRIVPWAISVDNALPNQNDRMAYYDPLNLLTDCRSLPFKDNCLDFIYSSHLIEDFYWGEINNILREWIRVLRFRGNLILYQPDQKVYLKHCGQTNQPTNYNHKEIDFSLIEFKKRIVPNFNIDIIYEFNEQDEINPKVKVNYTNYGWGIVLNKKL